MIHARKEVIYEICNSEEIDCINLRASDFFRAGILCHPLRNRDAACRALDNESSRRSVKYTEAAKPLAGQGVEPVEDRNKAGIGIVIQACDCWFRRYSSCAR